MSPLKPLLILLCFTFKLQAADPVNLNDLPSDLKVPAVTHEAPAPGKRVWQTNAGFEKTEIAHALYLPSDWQADRKYPVIMEYPGNGGYSNALGDRSRGRVQDCKLGYGLSEGKGMIWVSLPFVDPKTGQHAIKWWGDPDATAAYCKQTAARICTEYGGDPENVFLTGFSRGAIACNYIGLRDAEIAALWKAMLPHSHYDGVRKWNYSDSDAASARKRLARWGTRPQFISHELSTRQTEAFLKDDQTKGQFTFMALPYPNHSDEWVLKDIPERTRARNWLKKIVQNHPPN
ncbi:hypothetical protein Pan153_46570 [Gimesia panareensis]|uniref:Alpha/beta hydrolase family protein n=1 Tax=Gimesia panareensis TaxID=2527978 RepID=A0A518FUH9_9PLAN|nr:hypothetical protein [Gimesia panareensis]QDV19988.1 hypothetical protein Pan153_46570 [Gimesia panareensis]